MAVRLACFRHAASVDPEPGSNSPSLIRVLGLTLPASSDTARLSPRTLVHCLGPSPHHSSTVKVHHSRDGRLIRRPSGADSQYIRSTQSGATAWVSPGFTGAERRTVRRPASARSSAHVPGSQTKNPGPPRLPGIPLVKPALTGQVPWTSCASDRRCSVRVVEVFSALAQGPSGRHNPCYDSAICAVNCSRRPGWAQRLSGPD